MFIFLKFSSPKCDGAATTTEIRKQNTHLGLEEKGVNKMPIVYVMQTIRVFIAAESRITPAGRSDRRKCAGRMRHLRCGFYAFLDGR